MEQADNAAVSDRDTPVIVRLDGITKTFPGVVANDNISLEIRTGKVHCLLGENGAGKSTLISILAGMQQRNSGTIEIDGRRVKINSPRAVMGLGIGVVYQHTTLIPTLTVLENLMLGDTGRITLDRKEAQRRLGRDQRALGRPDRSRRILAAAVDMLGLWGYLRTNWNLGYGDKILPFVFLARLNPLGSIPLVAFYSVLATGGTIAAQDSDLSVDFLLVIVAFILVFMTIIEYLGTKSDLGESYVPRGLREALQFKRVEGGRK